MKKLIFLVFIAVAIEFASCLKDPDFSQLSTELVVSTNFDKNASFSAYKTYYVPDTVVNLGSEGADTILTDANALSLVNAVKTNMAARGYTLVARTAHPDLGLKIGVVKVLNVDVYYPGWWGGYPGWYYPWGGYYPYYYPYSTVYAYTTGTVIVDAYDVKNSVTQHQYVAVWNCTAFGALNSGTTANYTKGVNGINQGYIQSPYFKTN